MSNHNHTNGTNLLKTHHPELETDPLQIWPVPVFFVMALQKGTDVTSDAAFNLFLEIFGPFFRAVEPARGTMNAHLAGVQQS